MRYSKLFGKTTKSSKEFDSINATLLAKGGFIDQEMAGVYTFLPLGIRVLTKIENIVREEMDKIGCELFMPSLAPIESWEAAGRFETIDILFKASGANKLSKLKNDTEYVLNPTHEEIITPIAKSFNISYKDFPFAVYQIQTKFRNESRPKSGLLRAREFRMKDLYSFHTSEAELKDFYRVAKEAYYKMFERFGLRKDTYYVAASGGDFTEDFSHEFQTRCETGEDTVFYSKETDEAFNREVAPSQAPLAGKEEKPLPMEEVYGENIVGVKELCDFLHVLPSHTTKTLIYQTDHGPVVAAVRGDYEVNEVKLQKIAKANMLQLASEDIVKKLTGSIIGYAGIVGLPKDTEIYIDDSVEPLVNFETGGNKENYHNMNVNWERDVKRPDHYFDIKMAKEGDLYPKTEKPYEMFKACEVGNIFPLYTKFSKASNYYFTDEQGKQQIVYMGSYGFGTSRLMGVLVEKFHDDKGIIWPENVAPYSVHLVGLNLEDENVKDFAEKLYKDLNEKGVEVLYDDRVDVSAGAKFADADLIGIPYRFVVSKKTNGKVEVKKRNENESRLIEAKEALKLTS